MGSGNAWCFEPAGKAQLNDTLEIGQYATLVYQEQKNVNYREYWFDVNATLLKLSGDAAGQVNDITIFQKVPDRFKFSATDSEE